MRPLSWLFLLFLIPLVTAGCLPDKPDPQGVLQVGEEIVVPEGYDLVGYTIGGSLDPQVKMYCQLRGLPQYIECTGGKIGEAVIAPFGYAIVDVTVDPRAPGKFMFVCQSYADMNYYKCQPS